MARFRPSADLPRRGAVAAEVDAVLAEARPALRAALEAGSPRDTGEFAGSWAEQGNTVRNTATYAPYVDVDTAQADGVVDRVDATLGARVDHLFGGP